MLFGNDVEAEGMKKKFSNAERAAVQTLVNAGISEQFIYDELVSVCALAGVAEPARYPGRDMATPEGMTPKQLRGLPERIEAFAVQIERVNSAEWFTPERSPEVLFEKDAGSFLSVGRKSRVERLVDLPNALREYAKYLQSRTNAISRLKSGAARGTHFQFDLKRTVLRLCVTVRDVTGSPYWEQLSTLISFVANDSLTWAKSADDLRLYFKRNRKLVPPPERFASPRRNAVAESPTFLPAVLIPIIPRTDQTPKRSQPRPKRS
jgi:hypothetical protein